MMKGVERSPSKQMTALRLYIKFLTQETIQGGMPRFLRVEASQCWSMLLKKPEKSNLSTDVLRFSDFAAATV
jgi:hypothetical protein